MGSRGSKFDDGIKANRTISKAELRIENEGTQFSGLPDRDLAQGVYFNHAEKAIKIMHIAKNKAILNNTLSPSVTQQELFMQNLISGKLKQSNGRPIADGGLFVSENSPQMDNYIKNVLGFINNDGSPDKITTANVISSLLQKTDVFNMKYSDRYITKIGDKVEAGQIFEFNLDVPDINGNMHDTYVKLINVHGKNGEIYSIIDSIHAPNRTVIPIWR